MKLTFKLIKKLVVSVSFLVALAASPAFAQQTTATPVGFPVLPQPEMQAEATQACNGAQYASTLLGTFALGLGFADYFAVCPICAALMWSTAQPIIVSNMYWLFNCLGQ